MMKPIASRCSVPSRASRVSVVANASGPAATTSRRQQLAACVGSLALIAFPVQAGVISTVCTKSTSEEAGSDCREALLKADGGGVNKSDYLAATTRTFDLAPNVPAATLDKEYARDTKDLIHHMRDYTTIDVYSKGRPALIREIKADGAKWVSKYARGGSARANSARKMYVAVDSLFGHLSANGMAPLPAAKTSAMLATLDEVSTFLEKAV